MFRRSAGGARTPRVIQAGASERPGPGAAEAPWTPGLCLPVRGQHAGGVFDHRETVSKASLSHLQGRGPSPQGEKRDGPLRAPRAAPRIGDGCICPHPSRGLGIGEATLEADTSPSSSRLNDTVLQADDFTARSLSLLRCPGVDGGQAAIDRRIVLGLPVHLV